MERSHSFNEDTIIGLATPQGAGALGLIRLSGAKSCELLQRLTYKDNVESWQDRTSVYTKIFDGNFLLDECLAVLFRAPRSFTGEDVIELCCHGSRYILSRIIELALEYGARLAWPGEFTQRAFLNGKMKLHQAEAIADIIAANTNRSLQLAFQQMRGGYAAKLFELRTKLVNYASLLELELDFSEEDVEFANKTELANLINDILNETEKLIDGYKNGSVLKNGIPLVIAGKPNAGKSTLLNALLNENKAIVSPIPGATRDVIEDKLTLKGYDFRIMDTAGLREHKDELEAEGIKRTLAKIETASIVLFLFDPKSDTYEEIVEYCRTLPLNQDCSLLIVKNKVDVTTDVDSTAPPNLLSISALKLANLDGLIDKLVSLASSLDDSNVMITNVRHLDALKRSQTSFIRFQQGLQAEVYTELLAWELRGGLNALGEISGEITREDLLDNIFSKFCIGK